VERSTQRTRLICLLVTGVENFLDYSVQRVFLGKAMSVHYASNNEPPALLWRIYIRILASAINDDIESSDTQL